MDFANALCQTLAGCWNAANSLTYKQRNYFSSGCEQPRQEVGTMQSDTWMHTRNKTIIWC